MWRRESPQHKTVKLEEEAFLGRGASLLRTAVGILTAASMGGKAVVSLKVGGGGRSAAAVLVHSSHSM